MKSIISIDDPNYASAVRLERLRRDLEACEAKVEALTKDVEQSRLRAEQTDRDTKTFELENLRELAIATRKRDMALEAVQVAETERDAARVAENAAAGQRDQAVEARAIAAREKDQAVAAKAKAEILYSSAHDASESSRIQRNVGWLIAVCSWIGLGLYVWAHT